MARPEAALLVVDDDPAIRRALQAELAAAGYRVATAEDGESGLAVFEREAPDLVLTDLAMPRRDGFGLIAAIRAGRQTPVLVLTVRGGDQDKVRALDLGADDYVLKPFSMSELLARVRAQLRRARGGGGPPLLRFPELEIDRERRRVTQDGRPVRLTPTEFAILELLALNAGRPVSVGKIAGAVWRGAAVVSADTVRVHVGSLRRKLEPDPARPRYLITEPWVGYRFIAEPEE